ncbi:MAG: hypothetical protein R2733_05535 [Acidimicrobiales bacterium]
MATPNDPSNLRKRSMTVAAVAGAFIGAAGIAGAAVNVSSGSSQTSTLQSSTVAAQNDATVIEADDTSGDSTATESSTEDNSTDDSATHDHGDRGDHGDRVSTEEALTGDLADQVSAAALAAVPGGTIDRVETDDGGAAYEAHMTDADGNPVHVTFDEDLNVVEITEGGPGGRGGHGGRGDHDGDRGGHGAEEALTGDLADQVSAAALAAVPGGTIDRVETDADGAAYEAHMTDADGNHVHVTFDENLNVVEITEGR